MSKRDLSATAAALKQEYESAAPTTDEERALAARLETAIGPRRGVWRWVASFACAGAVAVVAVVVLNRPVYDVVAGGSCIAAAGRRSLETRPRCGEVLVRVARDELTLDSATRLAYARDSLSLRQGRLTVSAAQRRRGDTALRVRVAAGTVVVRGTRFIVEQHAHSGSLLVTEGVVDFEWMDGAIDHVHAQQRLDWPRPVAPTPTPSPDAGVAPDSTPAATPDTSSDITPEPTSDDIKRPRSGVRESLDLHGVMQRLFQLRSQHRYGEAAEYLGSTLAHATLSLTQRERLTFELGTLLQDELDDRARACRHWRSYLSRFPSSSRADEVRDRLRRCAKEKTSPP